MKNKMWWKYYCPTKVDDYVFQNPEIEQTVRSYLSEKDIPNLLISGVQGTGKSALVNVLLNELEISNDDVLTINASSARGIDTVRELITQFVTRSSLTGGKRVVVLEEADQLTQDAQKALRRVTEDYTAHVRFILTCNYENNIIAPLHSRFQHIHIDQFGEDQMIVKIATILESEGIVVDDVDVIYNHIDAFAPDFRKILVSLEQASSSGVLKDVQSKGGSSDVESEWAKIWQGQPSKEELVKLIPQVNEQNFQRLVRIIYENAEKMGAKFDQTVVGAAKALYQSKNGMADMQMLMHSLLIQIFFEA